MPKECHFLLLSRRVVAEFNLVFTIALQYKVFVESHHDSAHKSASQICENILAVAVCRSHRESKSNLPKPLVDTDREFSVRLNVGVADLMNSIDIMLT